MTGGDALLQQCRACGTTLYPRREVCSHCLTGDLVDLDAAGNRATLIAVATLHITHEKALRPLLPLRIGTAVLESGLKLIAYVTSGLDRGDAVVLSVVDDPDGVPVMVVAAGPSTAKSLAEVLRQGERR